MPSREPEYPKAMWLPDSHIPIYVNKEKEEDAKRAEGYTDRVPYFEFPKWLYHATAKPVVAKDAAEEKTYLAKGYVKLPVVAPEVEEVPIDPLALQAQISAQNEIIKELLAQRDFIAQQNETKPAKASR